MRALHRGPHWGPSGALSSSLGLGRGKFWLPLIKIAQFEREAARKLSPTSTDIPPFEKRLSLWRIHILLPSGAGIMKTGLGTRYASDATEPQLPLGTPPGSRCCKAPIPAIRWICTHGCRIASNLGYIHPHPKIFPSLTPRRKACRYQVSHFETLIPVAGYRVLRGLLFDSRKNRIALGARRLSQL
jgi:hypothetical protein